MVMYRIAHDILFNIVGGNKLPHFQVINNTTAGRSTKAEWYWNIGTGTGNSLW